MKLLLFLTLIVVNECYKLKDLRNRLPVEKSVIIKYMETTSVDFKDDDGKIKPSDIKRHFTGQTVYTYLNDSSEIMTKIDQRFGRAVLMYIKNRILAILTLLISKIDVLIDQKITSSKNFNTTFNIKFEKYRDLCVFPFLFNYGRDVGIVFNTTFFIFTFQQSNFVLKILKQNLKQLSDHLLVKIKDKFNDDQEKENKDIDVLIKKFTLQQLIDQIFIFSDKFCSPKPSNIVLKDLLFKDKHEYQDKETIGFIMKHEKCSISVSYKENK